MTKAVNGGAKEGVRIVFCDMDGTLFTPPPQHDITPRTARTIERLQKEKKVLFVVATGRPYPDVFGNVSKSGIRPDYYITSNGARIHDADRNVIHEVNLEPTVALDLLRLPVTPNADGTLPTDTDGADAAATRQPRAFVANVNCNEHWYTDKCLPEVRKAFHPSFLYQQVDTAAMTTEKLTGTHSVWLRGDGEALACVDQYIKRTYPGVATSKFALPYILDVFSCAVDKGRAVAKVCELVGVDLKDAAAFGDGMNDEPMLQVVAHPYIMENAPTTLKNALPHAAVVPSNADDGVAKTLEEMFKL